MFVSGQVKLKWCQLSEIVRKQLTEDAREVKSQSWEALDTSVCVAAPLTWTRT